MGVELVKFKHNAHMLFLSTYINKLDGKGRVSVPSSYRSMLTHPEFSGIIAYESISNQCIEACSHERITHLSESIDNLDPYSDERDAFATIILGGSLKLAFDSEGRILIPENLIKFANLSEKVCFVGKGQTFEIWNPSDFQAHYEKAKILATEKRQMLRLTRKERANE